LVGRLDRHLAGHVDRLTDGELHGIGVGVVLRGRSRWPQR
jgi:hypothetical protein